MASPLERRRNNLKAGVFVTFAIVLALFVIIVLSGAWDSFRRQTVRYTVRYPVSAGVSNLKPGADVRVGGVTMGQVEDIRPRIDTEREFREIDVDFVIDARVNLFAGARIFVSEPLLGTDAWLDVPSVGMPDQGVPAGGLIEGAVSPGLLGSVIGAGNAAKTSEIMDNARIFSAFLAELPARYDAEVAPTLADMRVVASDTRAIVETVKEERWPEWAASVDAVMTWAQQFTKDLDGALATANAFAQDGRDVIAESRESIHATVENAKATSADVGAVAERMRSETIEKVHALLDHGGEAIDGAVATIESLRASTEVWSGEIGEAIGNATLASQQLKLATIEVRRSPWKLLYRPEPRELEHELLYDATRSFALAAADLKAASGSVQGILANHGERLRSDPELMDRVRRVLLDPLQKYEEAQERLFDILLAERP